MARKNGYTAISALEKFMVDAIRFELAFPSVKEEAAQAEARVMLSWLNDGEYWVNLGDKAETSTRGRLLQLLPKVENPKLRQEIEERLKKEIT